MITHVKKNAQRLTGFTKPSHLECAVQFRNHNPFQTVNSGNNSKKNSLYSKKRNMSLELIEYMKYDGGVYNFGGMF